MIGVYKGAFYLAGKNQETGQEIIRSRRGFNLFGFGYETETDYELKDGQYIPLTETKTISTLFVFQHSDEHNFTTNKDTQSMSINIGARIGILATAVADINIPIYRASR
jgi:hypothetical protein